MENHREQARSHIRITPVGASLLAMASDGLTSEHRNNVNQEFSADFVEFCDSLAFGDPGAGTYDASQTSAD
ncbi:hypothetical protein ACS77_22365 [Pseudomonas syringae]|uniref:Uncharacterized protein n=1 Tax=Pseudomonas syringae TaxID=317 RepID=A0A0L1M2N5_PSESX|nr:hypothetical protein ACS77_22365 [Pseudomonas syringae]